MQCNFDIEFYKSGCEESFQEWFNELIDHGYTPEDAKEFLEAAYSAVGGEYGD